MSFTVHKFGGSCLKSESDLVRIAEIVNDSPPRVVVVISAFYGVTNMLLEAIDECESSAAFVSEIRAIHRNISLSTAAAVETEEFVRLLTRLQYDLKSSQSSHDDLKVEYRILAYGEKLATLVVADYLRRAGVRAEAVSAEDIGIVIIGEGRQRRIDLAATSPGLLNVIQKKVIPVITGWYGSNEDGEVAVLERGGSDVTAAAIAKILQANKVVLWKDVEGVLAVPPRLGLKGLRIPYLGYSEASELARLGSTILHPQCIEPVARVGIPIELRPLHGSGNGTVIGPDLQLEQPQVKAIVCAYPVRMVTIRSLIHSRASGFTLKVLKILERHDVEAWYLHALPGSIELIIDDDGFTRPMDDMERHGFHAEVGEVSAVISVVGSGFANWSDGFKQLMLEQEQWKEGLKFINGEGHSLHVLADKNELDEIIEFLSHTFGLIESEIHN
jgi:aspartate kinase